MPARLTPIFRDRDDLPAGADLTEEVQASLRDTRFLVVICSPTAAQSPMPHSTLVALSAIALACTPGSSRPVAMTVATANVTAYHFRPIAFSM